MDAFYGTVLNVSLLPRTDQFGRPTFRGLNGFGHWSSIEAGLHANEAFCFYPANGARLVTGK